MKRIKRIGIFNFRVIRKGEQYGRSAVNEYKKPLVEVYDSRYTGEGFTPHGQVIGQWFVSDARKVHRSGWDLHGGVDAWKMDAKQCAELAQWLKGVK